MVHGVNIPTANKTNSNKNTFNLVFLLAADVITCVRTAHLRSPTFPEQTVRKVCCIRISSTF